MHQHTIEPRAAIAALVLIVGSLATVALPAHADDVVPTVLGAAPSSGPVSGGTAVTLTGSGFVDGRTAVELDDTFLDATVLDAEHLTFVTPPHAAGAATVRVVVDETPSAGLVFFYGDAPTTPPAEQEPPVPGGGEVAGSDELPRHRAHPRPRHPAGPPANPPLLAETGSEVVPLLAAGAALVLTGTGMVVTGRPRRRDRVVS